jgi:hypothetical protein
MMKEASALDQVSNQAESYWMPLEHRGRIGLENAFQM